MVPGARCGVTQCTTPSAPGRACTPTAGCSMRLPHVSALRAGPRGPLSVTQGAAGVGRAPVCERGAHVPVLPGGRLVLRQELLGQAQAQRLPGARTPVLITSLCPSHLACSPAACVAPLRVCASWPCPQRGTVRKQLHWPQGSAYLGVKAAGKPYTCVPRGNSSCMNSLEPGTPHTPVLPSRRILQAQLLLRIAVCARQVPATSASRRGLPPTRCARKPGEKLTRRYAAILRRLMGNTPACRSAPGQPRRCRAPLRCAACPGP